MLELSGALTRRVLPLLTEESPKSEGFRTWVESGSFYISAGTVPDSFILQNVSLTEIVPYWSFDYERFTFSSLESLLFGSADEKMPNAVAWRSLNIYYAAFFGAHAIMRATGRTVIRIESSQARRMSQLISMFIPGAHISTGTYLGSVIQGANSAIDVRLSKLPETGGAHDQFWRAFNDFLTDLSRDISANSEPNATTVIGEALDIKNTLTANGFNSGTWLSAVRNELTYQHKHGMWFPFQGASSKAVQHIRRVKIRPSSSIRRDLDAGKVPVEAFCNCCHLIATINVDLGNAICERKQTQRFRRLWVRLKDE